MNRSLQLVWLCFIWVSIHLAAGSSAFADDLLPWMNPQLKTLRIEAKDIRAELDSLGPVTLGQTSSEVGLHYQRMGLTSSEPVEIHIDLGESFRFDSVTLVPAILQFDSVERTSYAFPLGFRVTASNTARFSTSQTLFDTGEQDFDAVRGLPLVIETPDVEARFIQIAVTRMMQLSDRQLFALGEIMVLSGNRNIAFGADVNVDGQTQIKPTWSQDYITDGRTPLGPPIQVDMPKYDGLFILPDDNTGESWIVIDLGKVVSLSEVRLHPIHTRLGADYPGYKFPVRFRVDASTEADFSEAIPLCDYSHGRYFSPGNNPVYLTAHGVQARYVRLIFLESVGGIGGVFGLPEIDVYSGDTNVARSGGRPGPLEDGGMK